MGPSARLLAGPSAPHSRMSLAGIQANSDWTPMKTFGSDDFWDIVAQILSFVIDREIMNYFALNFMHL